MSIVLKIVAFILLSLCISGCWATKVHPVHWTKTGVAASRGDTEAVQKRMKKDPEVGKYVKEYIE